MAFVRTVWMTGASGGCQLTHGGEFVPTIFAIVMGGWSHRPFSFGVDARSEKHVQAGCHAYGY